MAYSPYSTWGKSKDNSVDELVRKGGETMVSLSVKRFLKTTEKVLKSKSSLFSMVKNVPV